MRSQTKLAVAPQAGAGRVHLALCIAAALAASAMLYAQLTADTWLRGFDAYYYAVQADWLVRTGALRIPDSSPVHYFVAALQLAGLGTENALRLWVSASLALFCLTLLVPLRKCSPRLLVLVFVWALLSPTLLFTAVELPRNFVILPVLNLWLGLLLPARAKSSPQDTAHLPVSASSYAGTPLPESVNLPVINYSLDAATLTTTKASAEASSPPSGGSPAPTHRTSHYWGRIALLVGLPALAVLLHKTAIAYVAAAAAAWCLQLLLPERFTAGAHTRTRRLFLLYLGAALAAVCLYLLLAPEALRPADLARFSGGDLTPGVLSLLLRPQLPMAIKLEFGLAACALLVVLLQRLGPGRSLALPALLIATTCIPAFGTEALNLGERFGLLFPYLAVMACIFLWEKGDPSTGFQRDPLGFTGPPEHPHNKSTPKTTVLQRVTGHCPSWPATACILGAAVLLSCLRLPAGHPQSLDPPYAGYDLLLQRIAPQRPPLLIVHRGIHFYYKFTTGLDAFSYEPETHWDATRIRRLAYGVTPEEWAAYLPEHCPWKAPYIELLNDEYTLVREDCYREMRAAVREDFNPELYRLLWQSDMNPSRSRPAFLYAKHADDAPEEFPALPPGRQ